MNTENGHSDEKRQKMEEINRRVKELETIINAVFPGYKAYIFSGDGYGVTFTSKRPEGKVFYPPKPQSEGGIAVKKFDTGKLRHDLGDIVAMSIMAASVGSLIAVIVMWDVGKI